MPSEPVQKVLNALGSDARIVRAGDGWRARCPVHNVGKSKSQSLAIREGRDGKALVHCHAGCDTGTVVDALGLERGDLFPDDSRGDDREAATLARFRERASTPPAVTAKPDRTPASDDDADDEGAWATVETYAYHFADGSLAYEVLRKEPALQLAGAPRKKSFRQRRPDGAGGWTYGLGDLTPERRPLYRFPELIEAIASERPVLVVEGEKDVATAEAWGFTATTNSGGAKGWRPEHGAALTGATVYVIADNDEPGREWAAAVGAACVAHHATVRMLSLPAVQGHALPPKGDLTDWAALGGTVDHLRRAIDRAASRPAWQIGDPIPSPTRPSSDPGMSLTELWRTPDVRWLVKGVIQRTSLVGLAGEPGCGKSFAAIDLAMQLALGGARWLEQPIRQHGTVMYYAAEGTAGLKQRTRAWMQHFGLSLTGEPPIRFHTRGANLMRDEDVADVMLAIDEQPADPVLIVFDTLARSMTGGNENDAVDVNVVIHHAARLRDYCGATILFLHHTKKGEDVIRGSSAFVGGMDTVILARNEEGERSLSSLKQKEGADFPDISFRLPVVELGTDESGDPVSSCVAVWAAPEPRVPTATDLRPTEARALTVLARDFGPEGATPTEWEVQDGTPKRSHVRIRKALVDGALVYPTSASQDKRHHFLTPLGRRVVDALTERQRAPNSGAKSGSNGGAKSGANGATPATFNPALSLPTEIYSSGSSVAASKGSVGEEQKESRGKAPRVVAPEGATRGSANGGANARGTGQSPRGLSSPKAPPPDDADAPEWVRADGAA